MPTTTATPTGAHAPKSEDVAEALQLLRRICLADHCPGIVNGEAVLCRSFSEHARSVLVRLGLEHG